VGADPLGTGTEGAKIPQEGPPTNKEEAKRYGGDAIKRTEGDLKEDHRPLKLGKHWPTKIALQEKSNPLNGNQPSGQKGKQVLGTSRPSSFRWSVDRTG